MSDLIKLLWKIICLVVLLSGSGCEFATENKRSISTLGITCVQTPIELQGPQAGSALKLEVPFDSPGSYADNSALGTAGEIIFLAEAHLRIT